ncbi:MAG: ECF transporter S component [Levilactobacillus sp.]|uniref:ECF transporter S component n=1 Tax=Levilactobacillus sp. TaxID=2767919 RepID=UPI00258BFCAE|nr:ECF transporter S component [Levilactobacillus sp.]MCH4123304.1 ECF transporter S component [Levilactobacillus sp.]MCI1552558.1 ECF transporter S component [Levilactobacillus sp.]MCI1599293.1 ECF transporter S component [Levilactobacillus sp.]MCI1606831.1 ECF transporter S component [Levilactobacillus sp.]
MENSHSGLKVRSMVEMALFAGCAYVLMFVSVPIIPIVPYMKLDLSDLVVLLGMSLFGPAGAVMIAAVKELLYFVSTGMDIVNFIGVLTAFIADIAYILPISYVLKRKQADAQPTLSRQIGAVVAGTLTLTVVLSLANWWVITPLYLKVWGMSLGLPVNKLILLGVIPFNLLKGVILGILFILLSRRMAPWLAKHTLS